MAEKALTTKMVQNNTRIQAVADLYEMLVGKYGADKVFKVKDSEFSVYMGDSPTGEPMYTNYAPTVKEYVRRKTEKKLFLPYDGVEEARKYAEAQAEKEAEKAEKERKKAEKIAKDEQRRKQAETPAETPAIETETDETAEE